MYDALIIGAGPAGMAAAIYFARQKLNFMIISKDVGGQTRLSSEVGNYLGFQLMPGTDLVKMFKQHLADYKVKIQENETVTKIEKLNSHFKVISDKGEYEAKTVLLATGEEHRDLNVPGEKEFYGKGLTYCATCDAPLFKDKDVAVIGGGNSAMEAALFASKYAKKTYIVALNPELEGEALLIDRVNRDKNIELIPGAKTTEVMGVKFVTGLKYKQDGSVRELAVQGIFIEIGLIPVSEYIDFVEKNKWKEIVVDKNNFTNIEGLWAAGDVTDVTEKQIAVAVGEGSKASIQMIKYIEKHV